MTMQMLRKGSGDQENADSTFASQQVLSKTPNLGNISLYKSGEERQKAVDMLGE